MTFGGGLSSRSRHGFESESESEMEMEGLFNLYC